MTNEVLKRPMGGKKNWRTKQRMSSMGGGVTHLGVLSIVRSFSGQGHGAPGWLDIAGLSGWLTGRGAERGRHGGFVQILTKHTIKVERPNREHTLGGVTASGGEIKNTTTEREGKG